MNARRLPLVGLLSLCAVVGVFVFTGASASAATTRKLVNTFGGAGSAAPLSNPQGVAVDQATGDVYVADTGNNRVEEFEANGTFVRAFGANVGGLGENVCGGLVVCAPGTSGSNPGEFTEAKFVAVDNDPSSASFHDVYVGDVGDNKVSKFDASGKLIVGWGTGGQLDGSTTIAKTFGSLAGVAVDSAGTLYVVNMAAQLFTFSAAGVSAGELKLEVALENRTLAANGLAVAPAGNLLFGLSSSTSSVYEATPVGANVGGITTDAFGGFEVNADAFAVDPAGGDLYVVSAAGALEHYEFSGTEVVEGGGPNCPLASSPEPGCRASDSAPIGFAGSGIAVNSKTGDVYVANPATGEVRVYEQVTVPDATTEAAGEVGPTSAVLHGKVNPDGIEVKECVFEYGETTSYGKTAPCEEPKADELTGASPVPVHADLKGLTPGATYHFRLIARNANDPSPGTVPDPGADVQFATPPPPSIDSATVSSLTEETAVLNAKIDPQGAETHWHFEYVEQALFEGSGFEHAHRVPVCEAKLSIEECEAKDPAIPAGTSDVFVSRPIAGLEHDKTYDWRVVASNPRGTTTSSDHTFIYPTTGEPLPDNRAYEMVTPPQKDGALIGSAAFGSAPIIASDGSTVIAKSIQCFADAESCNAQVADGIGSPYAFTRTPAGWVTTALAPPATELTQTTPWETSTEAGAPSALFSAPTGPAGENDFYARTAQGRAVRVGPVTPPGPSTSLGGAPGAYVQAVSGDLSHVVWESENSGGAWPFDPTTGADRTYEYAGTGNSEPLLVGVSGEQGSHDLISTCGTLIGGSGAVAPGRMSSDGRTVFFTAYGDAGCVGAGPVNETIPVPVKELYARIDGESSDAKTVAISEPQALEVPHPPNLGCVEEPCLKNTESPTPPAVNPNWRNAAFVGASTDGSKVYFNSTQQLTDSATQDPNPGDAAVGCQETSASGCNLYLYDSEAPSGRALVDVSAGDTSGNGPRVRGVVAISGDGSHAYFVANGVLTGTANATGQKATDGANNLYVFTVDASHPFGSVSFIAALPNADNQEWVVAAGKFANVTPDGRFLVFLSHGALTPDDTSVSGANQVFRYDAETGALIRISIGNKGFNDNGNRSTPTPCGANGCSEDANIAVREASLSERQDLSMSDNGQYVFFQSPVALTPGARDDASLGLKDNAGNPEYAQNIYEWHEGYVYLLSDGQDVSVDAGQNELCLSADSNSSVCLLGSDASGSNVFFSTADKLVGTDTDTALDYYDARICTQASPCILSAPPPLPRCSEEACHGIPGSQLAAPSGGSLSFNGQGNIVPPSPVKVKSLTRAQKLAAALKACKKYQKRKKHAGCERAARQRYGAVKKPRSSKKKGGK
jgi:DNA-binding beta-propeller fold protein YncE